MQHWAAYTHAKHSHLTYLLKLLKHYQPDPCYDSLPATGHQLLYIDGRDFENNTADVNLHSLDDSSDEHEPSLININENSSSNEDCRSSSTESSTESSEATYHTISSTSCNAVSDSDSESSISSADLDILPNTSEDGKARTYNKSNQFTKKIKKRPQKLQAAIEMDNGGRLIYFGVERALCGDSPGIVFKHADLLQFVNIYKEDPQLLPQCLRSKVISYTG